MFGTSGVRGVVGEEITPELALKIGYAVGSDADTVTVGRDTRTTGEGLENAVVSGINAAGADAERVGVAPTPTVARDAEDTALVVTASHNPPEYNGFKPINSDGTAFDEEQREKVENAVEGGVEPVEAASFGDGFSVEGALERHVDSVLGAVGGGIDLKVVVDPASGSGSWITPHVLRRIGCDVVTINSQYDGRFPGRLPEPTDENLGDLKNAVVSTDADLGVAHDGDADRTAAVDRDGKFVEPDRLLAMLAEHEGTDEVVAPLNTSMVVDSVVDVIRTKVGDVYVSEKLKKTDGVFGGEPSNSWVFAEETLCPDGVLAAAKICEMASEEAITDRLDGLSDYEVRRTSHGCENAMKEDVMRRVEENVSEEFGEYTDVDGVRVETGEGWFLIRPSGTEPLIRVTAEAETEESADSLLEEAEEILKEALR